MSIVIDMVGRVRHALDHPPAVLYLTPEELEEVRRVFEGHPEAIRAGYRYERSVGVNGAEPGDRFAGLPVVVNAEKAAEQATAAAQ